MTVMSRVTAVVSMVSVVVTMPMPMPMPMATAMAMAMAMTVSIAISVVTVTMSMMMPVRTMMLTLAMMFYLIPNKVPQYCASDGPQQTVLFLMAKVVSRRTSDERPREVAIMSILGTAVSVAG